MWMDVFIDPDQPRETAATLFAQIRDAVAEQRLGPGDRLPTSRWLAEDLGVARSTVTTVYGRLVAEGILEARVGDGTFVAVHGAPDRNSSVPRPSAARVRRPAARTPASVRPDGIQIDLRSGRPDPNLFPLRDWRRAVRDASEVAPPGYGDPAGIPALRSALSSWVGRSRGLSAEPTEILVTSGAQQAFDLCAQVLVSDGGLVAFEEPGYEPARRVFEHRRARIQPVPVDGEGIVVDAIDPSAELVFVTPSHQSPTGVTMSAARRRALIELAYRHDLVVVEDDYDTEFRYVDRPLEPLHRRDSGGRVVYLGSFSKTLSPSLRIGFVAAPRPVVEALTAARAIVDVQPPHLAQAALTNLIVSGGFERHLRRTRPIYARRHQRVHDGIQTLHDAGLAASVTPTNAGLHAMLRLHGTCDHHLVASRAAERGLLVTTADEYWAREPEPALIIGFGLADDDQLAQAFDILADALDGDG